MILIWVVRCVCGRGCVEIYFEKGVWLGEHAGSLLGRELGMGPEQDMEVSWEIFEMVPSWAM